MTWPLTPGRSNRPELMDAPGLPGWEVASAYDSLRRVNRWLGNLWCMTREVKRFGRELPASSGRMVSILDVGSGSADIPQAVGRMLAATGFRPTVIALDIDPTATALAGRPHGACVVRADALRLPFADRSIDLVAAVKFAHHFEGEGLTRLVAEMTRVAARRVVVLDVRRHWVAYYGFIAWSLVFTRNRLVRHDGPLSVLRGFTDAELADLVREFPALNWTVRRYPGFQLAAVGRRDQGTAER